VTLFNHKNEVILMKKQLIALALFALVSTTMVPAFGAVSERTKRTLKIVGGVGLSVLGVASTVAAIVSFLAGEMHPSQQIGRSGKIVGGLLGTLAIGSFVGAGFTFTSASNNYCEAAVSESNDKQSTQ
jgi:drug/metabolite transporter (DMT)-like permease